MSSNVPAGINLVTRRTFDRNQERIEYTVYSSEIFTAGDWGMEGDIYSTNNHAFYIRTPSGWEGARINVTNHPRYSDRFLGLSREKPLWLSEGTRRSRTSKRNILSNDGHPAKHPRKSKLREERRGGCCYFPLLVHTLHWLNGTP
jgi:hypothetical protein